MKSVKISGVLLYLFGFVLILLLYVNYLFLPLVEKVSVLGSEHSADTAQVQAYDEQIRKIDDLKQNIADTKAKLAKAALNTGVTGKTAAEDIGQAIKATGITPQSTTVGEETADPAKTAEGGKTLCSVSVDLTVQCTDAQLLQILNYYEKKTKGVYYINIVNYTKADVPVVGITMTLYYFKLEGAKQ